MKHFDHLQAVISGVAFYPTHAYWVAEVRAARSVFEGTRFEESLTIIFAGTYYWAAFSPLVAAHKPLEHIGLTRPCIVHGKLDGLASDALQSLDGLDGFDDVRAKWQMIKMLIKEAGYNT